MTLTEQKQAQRQAGVAARKALSAQGSVRRKRTAAQGRCWCMQPGAGRWICRL